MSGLDERIGLALDWLRSSIVINGEYGGWGWVADVPPNPQNTSEVVCAFRELDVDIPHRDQVCALVRSDAVDRGSGPWAFDSVLDIAWRLRALMALDVSPYDPGVRSGVQTLLDRQDPEFKGWRLTGIAGSNSITATAAAVQALVVVADRANDTESELVLAAQHGTRFLIDLVLNTDTRANPLYALSFIASLLARPEIARLGGRRIDRARELAVERIMDRLAQQETRVEEERFHRGDVRDNWRHLSLHLSIAALGTASEPQSLFDPHFRRALVDLLELQEVQEQIVDRGGFRTSQEGFVTSYSTTQGLAAMASVRRAVNHRVNPALIYDVVCSVRGDHHRDPQDIVVLGKHRVTMNSGAGDVALATCGLGGLTIVVLSVLFHADLGPYVSRPLVVWGAILVAFGSFQFLAARLVRMSKLKLAGYTFAGFTALALPVITYLLA